MFHLLNSAFTLFDYILIQILEDLLHSTIHYPQKSNTLTQYVYFSLCLIGPYFTPVADFKRHIMSQMSHNLNQSLNMFYSWLPIARFVLNTVLKESQTLKILAITLYIYFHIQNKHNKCTVYLREKRLQLSKLFPRCH